MINLENINKDLNENWDRALPISLYYHHLPEETQQNLTNQINEFYFKNRKLVVETQQNLTNVNNFFFDNCF